MPLSESAELVFDIILLTLQLRDDRHCSHFMKKKRRKASIRFTVLVQWLCMLHPSLASTRIFGSRTPVFPTPPSSSVLVETQLQQVADSFESVLESTSQSLDDHIPMDPIIEACRILLEVMEKTGPKVVARDFGNNLKKIESVHIPSQTRTVSSLLQLEKDRGVHQEGDATSLYLSDQSGAMGLLWIRRTLAFQLDFYEQLLEGSDPLDAIHHAYRQQLKPYHGWLLTKCYNVIVNNTMPPRDLLLAMVGGYHEENLEKYQQHEEKTLQDLNRLVKSSRPLLQHWKRSFVELGMEDSRRV